MTLRAASETARHQRDGNCVTFRSLFLGFDIEIPFLLTLSLLSVVQNLATSIESPRAGSADAEIEKF